mgnify:FL=1|jgi:hypothetical protein
MSDDSNSQSWNEEMDRPEHERMFEGFIKYTKWTCAGIVVILLALLLFVYD